MRWGTNEMGDQLCAPGCSYILATHDKSDKTRRVSPGFET